MNEKKIDIDCIKEELDKVIKTLKPDSVFGYSSLYDIAAHFYKLGIEQGHTKSRGYNLQTIDEVKSPPPFNDGI